MCTPADPAQDQRLHTVRTGDKRQSLPPDNANESFYREPNITDEGHTSLAKLKESLKSFTRTNYAAEIAQVDLEKEILSLNQSFKELLDKKEKIKDRLRQLEEWTWRCRREHQDPTLVNEAQKVRHLRAIWARVLSAGPSLQADEATAESIKRKGDLGVHSLGLREAALIVYDASRDQSYPRDSLRLMTRGFKLLYGIDAEDALSLLFADKVMYFQEKTVFKIPRKSIFFSSLCYLRLTSYAVQAMMIAFLECHAWYMHTKDGSIFVHGRDLQNAYFSQDQTFLYFNHGTQIEALMESGLDVVRRLISVIKNEVEAHDVAGRFSGWKRRVQKAIDELDLANMVDLPLLSIDLGDPAQRKSVNQYYPSTDDMAKLDSLIRLQLVHQDQTSTAVRRANVDVADTYPEIRAWIKGLKQWNIPIHHT